MNGKTTSDTKLRDLYCLVGQVDMADSDRERMRELIAEVAHLKFCKGYDAAKKFYRECFDLTLNLNKETYDEGTDHQQPTA